MIRYSESHEYVRVEGEYGFIGVSDYAQNSLEMLFTWICPKLAMSLKPVRISAR